MNVLIKVDEKVYKSIKDIYNNDKSAIGTHAYMLKAIANGTPIPDNATNGEVIDLIFPYEKTIDAAWWNAPYQKGGKE